MFNTSHALMIFPSTGTRLLEHDICVADTGNQREGGMSFGQGGRSPHEGPGVSKSHECWRWFLK